MGLAAPPRGGALRPPGTNAIDSSGSTGQFRRTHGHSPRVL